ncbi:MAG: hypothetical protein QOH16_314 [Gaiellaceae bacterium]|jgi:hypothetical protein|nr:hypothetical protein [Gaiellaceae bacterium]
MPLSMQTMLRPRQEFPTPLFKVVAPLVLAGIVALVVYLATA